MFINDLASFQTGVDSIYNKCSNCGSTPSAKTPAAIEISIQAIYTNRYNSGVSATKKGTAVAGDVLSGKTFTNNSSVGISGTMTNRGAWTSTPTAKGKVTIPAGYHNGSGYVDTDSVYNAGVEYGSNIYKATVFRSSPVDMKQYTNNWANLTSDDFIVGTEVIEVKASSGGGNSTKIYGSSFTESNHNITTFSYNNTTGELSFASNEFYKSYAKTSGYNTTVTARVNSTPFAIWLGTVGGV